MKSKRARRRGFKRFKKGKKVAGGGIPAELRNKYTWVPRTRLCKLPLCQRFILTANTTAGLFGPVEYVFRLNSIYQPLLAPAGVTTANRVNGYTELSTQYAKYQVYAIGIDLIFTDPSADGMAVGIGLQNSTTTQQVAGLTMDAIDAKEGYVLKMVNNTGSQTTRFKCYIHLSKLEGLSKLAFDMQQGLYAAGISSNPTLTPLIRIACASVNDTTAKTITCEAKFTYYTRLFDKQPDAMPQYTS